MEGLKEVADSAIKKLTSKRAAEAFFQCFLFDDIAFTRICITTFGHFLCSTKFNFIDKIKDSYMCSFDFLLL